MTHRAYLVQNVMPVDALQISITSENTEERSVSATNMSEMFYMQVSFV